MIDHGLLELSDGQFDVWVRYQDGTERVGRYADKDAALAAWVDAVKTVNHEVVRLK